MTKNFDSFEQPTTQTLRVRRCGSTPASTILVAYATTSSYKEEAVGTIDIDVEKFYREDHTFYKVKVDDFNAKIDSKRASERLQIVTHDLQ
ncbi:hypothetical protein RB195_022689 [Necator americanus]